MKIQQILQRFQRTEVIFENNENGEREREKLHRDDRGNCFWEKRRMNEKRKRKRCKRSKFDNNDINNSKVRENKVTRFVKDIRMFGSLN